MDERKQPTAVFVIVILGALVCYVLGLGPACWLSSRFGGPKVVTVVYRPVTFAAEVSGSQRLMDAIQSYSQLGTSKFYLWTLAPEEPGNAEWVQGLVLDEYQMPAVSPPPPVVPSP